VNASWSTGDVDGAEGNVKSAKIWNGITLVTGILIYVAAFVYIGLSYASASSGGTTYSSYSQ